MAKLPLNFFEKITSQILLVGGWRKSYNVIFISTIIKVLWRFSNRNRVLGSQQERIFMGLFITWFKPLLNYMPKWHEACVCSFLWLVFKHYNLYGNKLIFLILEFTFNSIFVLGIFNNFVPSNVLSKMKVSKSGPFSVKMRAWTRIW